MDDEILYHTPLYTIARSFAAETSVPYGPVERPNGDIKHGWIDLRDAPERVATIPEAQRSEGFADLLRVISDPVSKIMSSACECAAFDHGQDVKSRRWQVGGFVMVMYKEAEQNTDPQNLVNLAGLIVTGVKPADAYQISYEMIIEPLRGFFGRTDCYALMMKPMATDQTKISRGWPSTMRRTPLPKRSANRESCECRRMIQHRPSLRDRPAEQRGSSGTPVWYPPRFLIWISCRAMT